MCMWALNLVLLWKWLSFWKTGKWDELRKNLELNGIKLCCEYVWTTVMMREYALLICLSMNALFSVNYLEEDGFVENRRTLLKWVSLNGYLSNGFRNMIIWWIEN